MMLAAKVLEHQRTRRKQEGRLATGEVESYGMCRAASIPYEYAV